MKKTGLAGYGWMTLGVVLFVAELAWAGTNNFLIQPAAPGSADSSMFTLEDIYKKVDMPYTNVTKRVGGFAGPTAGPTGTMHTLDEIVTLVSNRAPVAKTGQITPRATDDDGTLQKGVAWPTPRFVTNNVVSTDVVILDRLTGLMWTKDANLPSGTKLLADAFTYCTNLTYGGYHDWRLPNVCELLSLIDYGRSSPAIPAGHPFLNVQNSMYWSSSYGASGASPATRQLAVNVGSGDLDGYFTLKTGTYYVWPVRSGP
jgi:hypothetical protein